MSKEIQGPCPHARPDWRMCPHCLGLNPPLPEGTRFEFEETSPGSFLVRLVDEDGNDVELPDPTENWAFETKVYFE